MRGPQFFGGTLGRQRSAWESRSEINFGVKIAMSPRQSAPVSEVRTAPAEVIESSRSGSAYRRFGLFVDIFVPLVITAFGVFQWLSCARYSDFVHEDVSYYELAQSLLRTGIYGFNGTPQTVQPPGLPLLMAFLCRVLGCTNTALLQGVSLCFAGGIIASYFLMKRRHGRISAGVACVMVACSPALFAYVTRWIFPAVPYLLASSVTLLAATKLDRNRSFLQTFFWQLACAAALGASLLLQTSGVALILGILAWLAFRFARNAAKRAQRLWRFLPVAVAGCAVLSLWVHSAKNAVKEWPLEGYPGSYISQLVLKSGNQPELGHAAAIDYVVRFSSNLERYMDLFVGVFTNHWIDVTWSAFLPGTIVILAALGLVHCIFRRGSSICDWYFLFYAGICLLWPWTPEIRFLIPAIPLFFVYIFEGARVLPRLVRERSRFAGAIGVPLFATLGTDAAYLGLKHHAGGVQLKVSAAIWIICWMASIAMLFRKSNPLSWLVAFFTDRQSEERLFGMSPDTALRSVGVLVLFSHVALALAADRALAGENVHPRAEKSGMNSDIEAAQWIASHTEADAVVMARHVPIVFHHSHRKIIWFPPITNAATLMEGIQRNGVNYVVVVRRQNSYYLPPEADCFREVRKAYPAKFVSVFQTEGYQIFRVEPNGSTDSASPFVHATSGE